MLGSCYWRFFVDNFPQNKSIMAEEGGGGRTRDSFCDASLTAVRRGDTRPCGNEPKRCQAGEGGGGDSQPIFREKEEDEVEEEGTRRIKKHNRVFNAAGVLAPCLNASLLTRSLERHRTKPLIPNTS